MNNKLSLSALLLLSAGPAHAQEASWLRSATANALNPNISVIGDFLGQTGPGANAGGFALRETEIGLQAAVDPFARADFFVSFADGETPAIEEGYVTLLALPLGLQARGGRFRANFGKINMIHPHEQPQTDQPVAADRFLGPEGINDSGAELSRVFAPFGLFTEVGYSFLRGLGEKEFDPVTTTILDTNGNAVEIEVPRDPAPLPNKLRNYAHVAKARVYGDLTDEANVELGVSGALHQPELGDRKRLGAVDLTFRWKPLAQGTNRSFIWRTEGFYADSKLAVATDPLSGAVTDAARHTFRRGAYSYVEVQPAHSSRVGLRGDWSEDPADRASAPVTTGLAPYATYYLSEFNRFRLEYRQTRTEGAATEHAGFLQWTVILGPHGAHPF